MVEDYMNWLMYSKMLYKRFDVEYTSNIIKEEVI